jgi:hypothetical protein
VRAYDGRVQGLSRIACVLAVVTWAGACATFSSNDTTSGGGAPDAAADVGDEEAASPTDAATDADQGSDAPDATVEGGGPIGDYVVFVTAGTYTGNLGGIGGGDGLCTNEAKPVPTLANRKFRAWLSDDSSSPSGSFQHTTPGRYVLVDGTVVANDWKALTSGTLASGISLDANGKAFTGKAWTGTAANGSQSGTLAISQRCSNWGSASAGPTGVSGDIGATNSTWSYPISSPIDCTNSLHLYCFEQH